MNIPAFLLLSLGLFIFSLTAAFGQEAGPDSSSASAAAAYAKSVYHRALGQQEHLYSGSEYVDFNMPRRGHQFYRTSERRRKAGIFMQTKVKEGRRSSNNYKEVTKRKAQIRRHWEVRV